MKNEDTSKAFVFHLIVIFAFDGGTLFNTIHVVDFALNVMRMNSFFFFFKCCCSLLSYFTFLTII